MSSMKRPAYNDFTDENMNSKIVKKNTDDDKSSPVPTAADFEVHMSSKVFPLFGQEDVGALVVINDDFWKKTQHQSEVDCLFAFDISGSMAGSMVQQGEALVEAGKYVDNMMHQHRIGKVEEKPVVMNFAFGLWNNSAWFPGLDECQSESDPLPALYTPFKPAHEMGQAAMLNIKQKYFHPNIACGRTNMYRALEQSLFHLNQRRKTVFAGDPHHIQHLVMFTDGVPDIGQTDEKLCRLIKDCIGDNAVIVHMYVLGLNINLELTERLSVGTTYGCIAYAQEGEQLSDALKSIMEVISRPSVPFNIKTANSSGSVVHHRGVVQRGTTPTTHIKLNIPSQATPGDYTVCSIQLMTGTNADSTKVDVVAHHVPYSQLAYWNSSPLGQPSPIYESYQASERLEKQLKEELLAIVEENINKEIELDFNQLNSMITNQKYDLTPDGFQRLIIAVKTIKRESAKGRFSSNTSTPFSRRTTVIASMSRS